MRDEFTLDTKRKLAARVGYRCSFPRCEARTIGPSDESCSSTSNTGMACHIAAASDGRGARRYLASMTPDERTSIDNGIWMCHAHGKLIDTDETRFTIEMLKKWRHIAELRARLEQELGRRVEMGPQHLADVGLAEQVLTLNGWRGANRPIGDALDDSCVTLVWGSRVSDAVRDLLVELTRNAFQHGAASKCELRIDPRSVRLRTDGAYFSPWGLTGDRGGAQAVRELLTKHGHELLAETRLVGGETEHLIAFAVGVDVEKISPCVVDFSYTDEWEVSAYADASCETLYMRLPDNLTYSEVREMVDALAELAAERADRSVVFLAKRVSEGVLKQVAAYVGGRFPYRIVKRS